jgi:uroporphyrinogen-III decarboxylase
MIMKERWLDVSPDAEERQEERFKIWLSGANIPFENPEAEAAYQERVTLIKDAIQLKKTPARIPICPSAGHFPIEYAGISWHEAMYDYDKLAYAWEKFHVDFAPDAFSTPRSIVPGKALDMLDFKLYRWAGHGLRENQEYQFVEGEYMKAEEYQALIDDPTGFFLTVYFPRIFGSLTPLAKMPVLPPVHELPLVPPALMPFGMKEVKAAFKKLSDAGDEVTTWLSAVGQVSASIMGKGYPSSAAGLTKAPFDVIGDSLRGTRGALMDMFRHPDELLEACERITPFMIKYGVAACKAAGHLIPFIPLHKGADGFMSDEQFKTFYWPTLRRLIIGLIDEGIVPQLFVEGGYNQRLEVICDIPKGKTVWWFDTTDMARAKETVGTVSCIAGNVPLDLLCTGTPDDVRDYCKKLIDTAGKDGGFILSSGAGIQGSRAENVKAMIDFSREYGVYR